MPSGIIHQAIAKKLENYLEINSNDYYVGNVAPDSWRNSSSTKVESHFYFDGKTDPDYKVFYDKYKPYLNNDYVLGYFIHLITDYYWYYNHYTDRVETSDKFKDILGYIVKRYDIKKINFIDEKTFMNPIEELETSGINITLKYLSKVPGNSNISKKDINKIELEISKTTDFVKRELKKFGIKKEYKLKVSNIFKHLHTVNKHRWNVFKLCCKVGIPFQGLVHDLSKYSFIEFFESARYFEGTYSPIRNCKMDIGYSKAWLHHKGRNKHHYEYWYDYALDQKEVLIPLKYFKEMICDSYAAGIVYQGKNWYPAYQEGYWNKTKKRARIHPAIEASCDEIYALISKKGMSALNKKNLEEIYYKNVSEYN